MRSIEHYPTDAVADTTAAIDSASGENNEKTSWLQKATDKVKDTVNLDERLQEAKKQGEQILNEQGPQVFEQAMQVAKTLTKAPPPQKEPELGWLNWPLLYCWYAFCSPYAFFAYVSMILFTFSVPEGDKPRVFSGSPVYCFILCLSTIIGLIVTLNTSWQGTFWELAWKNDTFILFLQLSPRPCQIADSLSENTMQRNSFTPTSLPAMIRCLPAVTANLPDSLMNPPHGGNGSLNEPSSFLHIK